MAGGRRLSVGNNSDCEMFYTLFRSKSECIVHLTDCELVTAQSRTGADPRWLPVLPSIRILVVIVVDPFSLFLLPALAVSIFLVSLHPYDFPHSDGFLHLQQNP